MNSSSEKKLTESEQILYLKRLLATLKVTFEEKLQSLNQKLKESQIKGQEMAQQLALAEERATFVSENHLIEVQSLKEQLIILRDRVKGEKQSEQNHLFEEDNSSLPAAKTSSTSQELIKKEQQIIELQKTLEQERVEHKKQLSALNEQLSSYRSKEDQQELISSHTSAYQLRQELDLIKKTLKENAQETTAFETRYAALFDERMHLEYKLNSLIEKQSQQKQLEEELRQEIGEKVCLEQDLIEKLQQVMQSLEKKTEQCKDFDQEVKQLKKENAIFLSLQEKYEQLKSEYLQSQQELDETLELYSRTEKQLTIEKEINSVQIKELQEKQEKLQNLMQEREDLLIEMESLHLLKEEAEANLQIAQQHLAKKVKEVTVLEEQLEQQSLSLEDYAQMNAHHEAEIFTLKANIEELQKREEKLQQQLHESLKNTELQVAKWETKYFEMYDKWQISENQVLELKKLKEKHLQMQKLLSNLGNYMGSPSKISAEAIQEVVEQSKTELEEHSFLDLSIKEANLEKLKIVNPEDPLQETSSD